MNAFDFGTQDRQAPETIAAARPGWLGLERRALVLGAAFVIFVVCFGVRELDSGDADVLGALYVIPVALIALDFGLVAGLAAAIAASALLVGAPASDDASDWAVSTSVVVFTLVGALAGRFSDRARALHAAVSADNQRLSVAEQERAGLHAELQSVHGRLRAQLCNAEQLLMHHEEERRGIARQLHEEAAQTMAGALLAVQLLERGMGGGLTKEQFAEVRCRVRECIVDLRELATALRPPVLDELGLGPALDHLAELARERSGRPVAIEVKGMRERLPADVETAAYRVVEGILHALPGPASVVVDRSGEESVRIAVRCDEPCADHAPADLECALASTRARLELMGGRLELAEDEDGCFTVAGELPLAA